MKKAVRAIVLKGSTILVIKRNKFGKEYYTLPGGGVELGEDIEAALRRELKEETGLQLGASRLVFIEQSGEPYGTQYVYTVEYIDGDPALDVASDEASISALGHNLYLPMWLSVDYLESVPFVTPRLRQAVLGGIQHGFPDLPEEVV